MNIRIGFCYRHKRIKYFIARSKAKRFPRTVTTVIGFGTNENKHWCTRQKRHCTYGHIQHTYKSPIHMPFQLFTHMHR